jgi:hypothetical protein
MGKIRAMGIRRSRAIVLTQMETRTAHRHQPVIAKPVEQGERRKTEGGSGAMGL